LSRPADRDRDGDRAATVAALVDNEGLGRPDPHRDLERRVQTELIAAGGSPSCSRLAPTALLVLLQRLLTPWTRARNA